LQTPHANFDRWVIAMDYAPTISRTIAPILSDASVVRAIRILVLSITAVPSVLGLILVISLLLGMDGRSICQ